MASYTHQIPDDSEMVSIGTPSDDDLSENKNNPDTESQPSSGVTFNLGGSCYSRSSTSSLRARKLDLERRICHQRKRENFPSLEVTPDILLTPELELRWESACEITSKYLNSLLVAQLNAELDSVKFRLRGKEEESSLYNAVESLRVQASTSAGGAQGGANKPSVEKPSSSQPTPAPRPLMSIRIPDAQLNRLRRQRPRPNGPNPTNTNRHPNHRRKDDNNKTNQPDDNSTVSKDLNPAIRYRDIRYFSSS